MAYRDDGTETSILKDFGSLFYELTGDKSNNPNYKLNPKWTSDRKRNSMAGAKYILKTEEELELDKAKADAPVTTNLAGNMNMGGGAGFDLPTDNPVLDYNALNGAMGLNGTANIGKENPFLPANQRPDSLYRSPLRNDQTSGGPLSLANNNSGLFTAKSPTDLNYVDLDLPTMDDPKLANSNVSNMLGDNGASLNYLDLHNAIKKPLADTTTPTTPTASPYVDDRTKFGNFMATIGGDDYKTADELNNMSVADREAYLKNRDKQKWGGIAEAIAIGDDQFNMRNVNEGKSLREKGEAARLKSEKERQARMSNNNFALTVLQNDNRFSDEEKKAIAGSPDRLEEYGKNAIKGNVAKDKVNELAMKGTASIPNNVQNAFSQAKAKNPKASDSQLWAALKKNNIFDIDAHYLKNLTPDEITYINTFGGSGETLAEKISGIVSVK